MKSEIKVYQKENNLRFGKLIRESLRDIYDSRFLSRQLAIRDIKATYRQSYFGILWAFVTPLATAFVWIILNSSGTVRLSATGIPYPVYALSGTLLWSIVTEAINAPMLATTGAKSFLSKINFPKEALIISGAYKLIFNSLVKVFLLFVFAFFYGVGYHHSMWLFPLALFGALLFGITLGLFLTPLGMLYKDVSRLITIGLQFLMYATPVVYAIPKTGILKDVMGLNPLTPIILTGRDFLTGMAATHYLYFIGVVVVSIPLFFLSLVIYRISMPILVERMNG